MDDTTLRRLRHEADDYETEATTALAIRAAAGAGEDIEGAVPALAEALDRSAQPRFLAAVAEALVLHLLGTHQLPRLVGLFAECRQASELSDALCNLCRAGFDLGDSLPLLLDARPYELDATALFGAHLEAGPGRVQAVMSLFLEHAPGAVVSLFRKQFSFGAEGDPAIALPALRTLLGHDEVAVRLGAAGVARSMAYYELDVRELWPALEAAALDANTHVARDAAYALCYAVVTTRDNDALARVRSHASENIRIQLVLASGALLDKPAQSLAALLLRIALGDAAPTVRAAALEQLETAAKNGTYTATADDLHPLVPARLQTAEQRQFVSLVLDPDVCKTCTALPRSGGWTQQSSLPAALGRLEPHGALHACPDCHNAYLSTYEEEWDDGSYSESWSLQRLLPWEARAQATGELGVWWSQNYDRVMARQPFDLEHPRQRVREDAAWVLMNQRIAERDWDGVHALVHHEDAAIRSIAANVLEPIARASMLNLPGTLFEGPGADEPAMVRLRAWRGIRSSRDAVHSALASADPAVLLATVAEIDSASRDGTDIRAYLERLLELADHPSEPLRQVVSWVLTRPDTNGAIDPRVLPRYAALLESADRGVVEWACRAVRDVAREGVDASPAVPRLVALLDGPSVWHATSALAALAGSGIDVSSALPRVIAHLQSPQTSQRGEFMDLLSGMHKGGADLRSAHPVLIHLLVHGRGNQKTFADSILRSALADPDALTAVLPTLESALPQMDGYYADRFSELAAAARIRAADWVGLHALLALEHPNVTWGTCTALKDAAKRGTAITPVLPTITALANVSEGVRKTHIEAVLDAAAGLQKEPAPHWSDDDYVAAEGILIDED